MRKLLFAALLLVAANSIDGVPVGDLSNGRTDRVILYGTDMKGVAPTTTTDFGGPRPAVELQAP